MNAADPAAPIEPGRGWPRGVRVLTTTRAMAGHSRPPFDRFNLGSRCGDDPDAVASNRAELIDRFGLPEPPRWLRQVHSARVAVEPGDDEPEADAALTRTPGRVLAILTADCLPVALASADGRELALVHAGWRGLAAGVLDATLATLRTAPSRLCAWLGPAAGPAAYEVGEDVFAAFVGPDPAAEAAFVPTRPGHWRVDLPALARRRLAAAGVTRIDGGECCTISDPLRFHSHRRDGVSGRLATLGWIALP